MPHSDPSTPLLFDRSLLRRRLLRAHRMGYADFLLRHAAEDLSLRLSPVLRTFEQAADIGTPTPLARDWLMHSGRCKEMVRLSPVPETASESILGDEETVPFESETFDLAVSLLSLHAVNDLPGALVQIRRILKPDGLFVGCLIGGESLHELRRAFLEAETLTDGGASPRVAPFADVKSLGQLMQRAGFALPVTDSDTITVRYANVFALLKDLRAMGATNVLIDRRRTPLRRETLFRMADIYRDRFSDPDGKVRATFELVWLLGWAPHPDQPKPLTPGKVTISLGDAIEAVKGKNPKTS